MTVLAGQLPLHVTPAVPTDPIHRLTVSQYHELLDRGILTEDDPVELIEGWLISKMGKNPPHVNATDRIADKLTEIKPSGWCVRRQDPITTEDSEPEPDVVLARGNRDDYDKRHPGPGEIALLVEVAESTLTLDRTTKCRAYARAGIAVYWVVNLVDRWIEVYSSPSGPVPTPSFRDRVVLRETESVSVVIDGRTFGPIAVRDLLPRV